ncbi:MAG: CPBP family intramembrane metalloprotease [Chloroflexi bacterium]|nr:MAG: CPBP family intramembrane metalloprotease [Chloroflexota bacterium]
MTDRRREFLILWAAGMVGVALLLPYSLSLTALPPNLSFGALVAAALVQNGILLAVAVGAGLWCAGRVRLGAPILEAALRGEAVLDRLRRLWPVPVATGLAVAIAIVVLDLAVFEPNLPAITTPTGATPGPLLGLLASFYGGITEELLTRLFMVSFFAWLLSPFLRGAALYWFAIVVAALLFGAGHLPATGLLMPLTPLVVIRALVLNGVAGIAFGVLYWRYGLEAAMLGHFAGDLGLHVVAPALSA